MANSPSLAVVNVLPDLRRAPELKKLKIQHRRVLTLHLMGLPGAEVAQLIGRSKAFVYDTIRSQPGQAFLERAYELVDDEIKALMPSAVHALRRNLKCGDGNVEVRAASEVMKLNKKYDTLQESQSIEDVIERVLEAFDDGESRRVRISEKRIVRRIIGGSGEDD